MVKIYNYMFPLKLVQTYKYQSKIVKKSQKSFLKFNPEFSYQFFNDFDCYQFIKDNFDIQVVNAYQTLIPKEFKADLFRYCYLYKHGGIYSDIDILCLQKLVPLMDPEYDLIISRERRKIPGLYQAFIICKPHLELFRIAIEKIVLNTQIKYYPPKCPDIWTEILAITGPVLLGNALCNLLEIDEFSCHQIYHQDIINNKIKIKILVFKKNRIRDQGQEFLNTKMVKYTTNYKTKYKRKKVYN